jgi:hypothetical protein
LDARLGKIEDGTIESFLYLAQWYGVEVLELFLPKRRALGHSWSAMTHPQDDNDAADGPQKRHRSKIDRLALFVR